MLFIFTAVNAENSELFPGEEEIEFDLDDTDPFGIWGLITCKLCEKTVQKIISKIDKNTSKVSVFLFI